ncbi:DUF4142 domain-containing protein [Fibrisoma montanum]|uniref:DUF4142 domain-containing protein n=1 Tax=Fibrisoma montanum TaxID=2305895 RepID=A0A418M2I0_9BACT|nr:DUF4142 domain-containing protein [Fibrisoma montanum]RIV19759.1 DUF4142 domain-containing protein [Fibrisoma montanum]
MKTNAITLGALLALTVTGVSFAQQNSSMRSGGTTSIGKYSPSEFDSKNKQGAQAVAAVNATNAPLSQADQDLMKQVAMGGMMQLQVSQLAVDKASSEDVRKLAQAEVEEQTGLSAKLKEIASAKGVTLPTTPDAETQAMLTKMQGLSGAEFDRQYVQQSGVNGHEKLDRVMSKVESDAKDQSLKNLAKAAHPLVKTHLQVSRDELNQLAGSGSSR